MAFQSGAFQSPGFQMGGEAIPPPVTEVPGGSSRRDKKRKLPRPRYHWEEDAPVVPEVLVAATGETLPQEPNPEPIDKSALAEELESITVRIQAESREKL